MSEASFILEFIAATDFREPLPISLDTELASLPEWDSLAALGVIVMFDMHYGMALTGDDLLRAVTVGDLYRRVR